MKEVMRNNTLLACLFLVFAACFPVHAVQPDTQSPHAAWVATEGRLVPMDPTGDRRIKVDGELSDWGDLREEGIVLHQLLDYTAGPVDETERDAALVKLLHDEQSIYVAVRVADKSILNPFDNGEYNGDCIELFLDARPPSGKGPNLGDDTYSDGAYQLLLVPPTQTGRPFRWREVDKKIRKIGPIEAAGRLTDGGYEIEAAIPLTSLLDRPSSNRIRQPFGFEIMIDDIDEGGMEGKWAPQRAYSWSAKGAYFQNPSKLACAVPGYRSALASPFVRAPKFRSTNKDGKARFEVALARQNAPTTTKTDTQLRCRYAATDFDSAKTVTNGVQRADIAVNLLSEDRYQALGVVMQWFELDAASLLPGRYYVEATTDGGKGKAFTTRFYSFGSTPHEVAQPLSVDLAFDRLAQSWTMLTLSTHFADGTKPVLGRATIAGWPALWFELSEAAQRATDAGKPFAAPFTLRLQLRPEGETKAVWQHDLPIRLGEMTFAIEASKLGRQPYALNVSLTGPGNRERDVEYRSVSAKGALTIRPTVPLIPIVPYDTILRTSVSDAAEVLTNAVQVGDPARSQFPKNDMRDCQARSIHDLHSFEGRVYVGYGDWNENRGPIQIWSFAAVPKQDEVEFQKEFLIDEESVDRFRDFGGKLYVPGIDSAERSDDQWELGSLYVKADGKWQKLRTIPNGIHVFDVVRLKDRLFVTTGTETGAALFQSADGGKSWSRCGTEGSEQGRFYEMAAVGGNLFISSARAELGAYEYTKGELQRLLTPVAPIEDLQWAHINRVAPFGGGIVYKLGWRNAPAEPLLYLANLERGAVEVELFRDRKVRDIVARDGTCYVLVASDHPNNHVRFTGTIYSSTDLKSWTRLAEVAVPALPNSMELLNSQFYVGLANHLPWRSADAASGTIWRLTR